MSKKNITLGIFGGGQLGKFLVHCSSSEQERDT